MNDIIITGGYVPNLNGDFTIAALGVNDTYAVLALMEKVRNDLAPDQKHFLKPLTLHDLRDHAEKGHIVAAVENETGRLAGSVLLTKVDHACTANFDKFAGFPPQLMSQDTAVIKIFVDMDFRGKGLMASLLEKGEDHAANLKICDLVAKVADDNHGSRAGFKSAGFNEAADGADPVLGYAVHYWHKETAGLARSAFPRLNGTNAHNVATSPHCL